MLRSGKKFCLFLVVLLVLGQAMYGQQNVGLLKGTVRDPSGAIIVGASLTLKSESTGTELTAVTDATGSYAFLNLLIGAYTLTVSQPGFKTFRQTDIRVVSGEKL